MSSNLVGILIIVGMIVVGIFTGGDIFRGGTPRTATSTVSSDDYSNPDYVYDENDYSDYSGDPSINVNASVYEDKVTIDGVNEPGSFNEYVSLSTSLEEGERLGITGWKIRSTVTGAEIVIGGGANIPTEGVRDQSPIILSESSHVIVSPGSSPIGTSFRINKCAGFFEERHNFSPSIWTQCPLVEEDAPPLSRDMNDECLDYIETLPSCQIPRERDIPDDISLSNSCKSFLFTKVNYLNCVVNHVNDEDFYESEWRIYTNQRGITTREKRDTLVLLDNAGKIVDTYSYGF